MVTCGNQVLAVLRLSDRALPDLSAFTSSVKKKRLSESLVDCQVLPPRSFYESAPPDTNTDNRDIKADLRPSQCQAVHPGQKTSTGFVITPDLA